MLDLAPIAGACVAPLVAARNQLVGAPAGPTTETFTLDRPAGDGGPAPEPRSPTRSFRLVAELGGAVLASPVQRHEVRFLARV